MSTRARTCVFFHAHPDDEALLTGGTMARLSAAGHRVVLVTATAGEQGLAARTAARSGGLGEVRMDELRASARALGCARVEWLGYADSGLNGSGSDGTAGGPKTGPGAPRPFAEVEVEQAAGRLADLLMEERADLVTGYDPAGGYGHPDHVQVHRVAEAAARMAGTPTLVEATVDRGLLLRALKLAGLVYRFPPEFDRDAFTTAYTPRPQITHRIDVRRHAAAKRAGMAAHLSQAGGGESERTLAALLRMPLPLFRLVLGTEWYVRRSP